jgi:hypothetical protein
MEAALRPSAARIGELLIDLAALKLDLADAKMPDEAAFWKAEITALQHSLFLAGYQPEEG